MRLLGITDLHGSLRALKRILAGAGPVEAILLGGDITHFGSPDDAETVVRLAGGSTATVLAVAGNCDSADIEERLVQLGVSLDGRGVVLEEPAAGPRSSLGLHGLSGIPPWFRGMYQFSEDDLAAGLEAGYAQVADAARHAVLAHVPPHGGSLDRVTFGRHVGSKALRAFVDRTEPSLVLCGHIHERRGIERLGEMTLVNCGQASKGHYARVDVAAEIDIELRRA
ncbi:MAG: metallophosphoesterase family protein [Planctomycetes bacterium]|nr:metallophosphoesterase family protein [Planctomycetota bacterium]